MYDPVKHCICNEFIPKISIESRVTTIYPVKNNKADYSNGYFLGTNKHQACKIHWDSNGNVKFSDYAKNKGRLNEMFIRNGELSTREANQRNIANADITEAEVQAKTVKTDNWSSGLVKIGTKIWSRKDYSCETNSYYVHGSYFTPKSLEEGACKTPKGYKLASGEDFEMMQALLSAKGELDYTKYLFGWDSKTGFNAEHASWYELYENQLLVSKGAPNVDWEYHSSDPESGVWYLTSEKEFLRIDDGGEMQKGDPITTFYAGKGGMRYSKSSAACLVRIVMD